MRHEDRETQKDRTERHENQFVHYFKRMQEDANIINQQKGFGDDDVKMTEFEKLCCHRLSVTEFSPYHHLFASFRNARVGLKLCLTVGEISETLEAVRKQMGSDKHIPDFLAEETELADVIIRLMNYATERNLRLADAIVAKTEYNRTRTDHSKEARAQEHGKKF